MIKEKHFSPYSDFKTGSICKLLFYIGCFFLIIFIISISLSGLIDLIISDSSGFLKQIYDFGKTEIPYTLLALSLILFFISFVFYFFNSQFKNLSKISEEIEYIQKLEEEIDKIKESIGKVESRLDRLEKKK